MAPPFPLRFPHSTINAEASKRRKNRRHGHSEQQQPEVLPPSTSSRRDGGLVHGTQPTAPNLSSPLIPPASGAANTSGTGGEDARKVEQPQELASRAGSASGSSPAAGGFKFNVDAGLMDNGFRTIGGLLRDHTGRWILGFQQLLPFQLLHVARQSPHPLQAILQDCYQRMMLIPSLKVHHISRLQNRAAHILCQQAKMDSIVRQEPPVDRQARTVTVSNISDEVLGEDIWRFFSSCGAVEDVEMKSYFDGQIAEITFKDMKSAEYAAKSWIYPTFGGRFQQYEDKLLLIQLNTTADVKKAEDIVADVKKAEDTAADVYERAEDIYREIQMLYGKRQIK